MLGDADERSLCLGPCWPGCRAQHPGSDAILFRRPMAHIFPTLTMQGQGTTRLQPAPQAGGVAGHARRQHHGGEGLLRGTASGAGLLTQLGRICARRSVRNMCKITYKCSRRPTLPWQFTLIGGGGH